MLNLSDFASELRRWSGELIALDGLTLGPGAIDASSAVWKLVWEMAIIDNTARLVATTKTLHHLLPDLVVPIDRQYTGTFFGWHAPEFQTRQKQIFEDAWKAFVHVAGTAQPERFVGSGWRTSTTKVIDNAVVGYCIDEGLTGRDLTRPRAAPTQQPLQPRRSEWTLLQLKEDLDGAH